MSLCKGSVVSAWLQQSQACTRTACACSFAHQVSLPGSLTGLTLPAGVRDAVLDAVHGLYIQGCSPLVAAKNLVALADGASIGAPCISPYTQLSQTTLTQFGECWLRRRSLQGSQLRHSGLSQPAESQIQGFTEILCR